MSITKGYSGSVKAGGVGVGEIKNYSLTESADTVETSTLGSGWADNTSTIKRWSGSLSGHFDYGDSGQDAIRAGLAVGDAITLDFYVGGESGAGNVQKSGTGVIESIDITNDVAGVVEASISFVGSGELITTALS